MAIINTACGDALVVHDRMSLIGQNPYVYYGTIPKAAAYFATKLYQQSWLKLNDDRKLVCLVEASRLVDQLAYKGSPVAVIGYPAFPRIIDDIQQLQVPLVVEWATYEIALALSRGTDVDRQIASLSVTSQGFASRRGSRDATHIPTHLRAGIPSIIAWNYLLEFTVDSRTITFAQPT